MNKTFFLLAFISFFLISCISANDNEEFLLVSSVLREQTEPPYHEIWSQGADSLKIYNPNKNEVNSTKIYLSNLNKRNTIEFGEDKNIEIYKTLDLYENLYAVKDGELNYRVVKTKKGDEITKTDFLEYTNEKWFQTEISKLKTPNSDFRIIETLSFSKNEVNFFWEYYLDDQSIHKERETVTAKYISFENQLFLIPSSEKNPYPIYHVSKAKDGKLQLNYFTEYETTPKIYTLSNQINPENYKNYSLCMDYFQRIYYFDDDVRVLNGNDFLKNYLNKDLQKIDNEGFINIHFTVNCEGNVGRFGLEMMDFDYQPTVFKPEVISHLVKKLRQLKEWENLEKETNWPSRDTKLFYVLKIENGIITDIAP